MTIQVSEYNETVEQQELPSNFRYIYLKSLKRTENSLKVPIRDGRIN